jgi:diaminopimelate decarboxylase
MTSLHWEELRLQDAIEQTGTPVLLASERRLRGNIGALRNGFASTWPNTLIRYCAKTNPELGILRVVCEEGIDVLTSHEAEVRLALAAGFAPPQLAFQRPVLDEREVDAVLAMGVRRLHAFRASDLDLLSRVATRRRIAIRVSLRIALGRSGMRVLTAASNRLGFDKAAAGATRPREGLTIDALNTYIGTQQEKVEAYRPAIRELVRLAVMLRERGLPIEELNLGGGIPSNSLRRLTPSRLLSRRRSRMIAAASPADYAAALGAIFKEEVAGAFAPRLVLEPGRSVVGNAVVLLTRVAAEQGRWRFLDCGRNVLAESPLAFTRWIAPLMPRSARTSAVHLAGPTLNTLDVVDRGRAMPEVRTGDVLAIGDAGAYTIARATRYAGLAPAVWLARMDGSLVCIRRPETYADLTAPMAGAAD